MHPSTPLATHSEATQILDDAWAELRRSPFVQRQLGTPIEQLPDVSAGEARRRSNVGRLLLERLERVDSEHLPHHLALGLRAVRFRAQTWSKENSWYDLVCDPLGIGYFGLYLPSAYCGGLFLNFVHGQLASFPLISSGDCDRYLKLAEGYASLIDQFTTRTENQASRGIRIPQVQIPPARALLKGLKSALDRTFGAALDASSLDGKEELRRELRQTIAEEIEPAFDRALELLSERYLRAAPEAVGCSQFPAGPEIYEELVRFHTTLDLTPTQVHAVGHERLMALEREKAAIRKELRMESGAAMLAHLGADPQWRADSTEGVTEVFQRYLKRLPPLLDQCFARLPRAPYGVEPLPQTLEGSMTYGYFDPPNRRRPTGLYRFNARNLRSQPLFALGSLTYHELMPGHHLQIALQYENRELHPFQQFSFVTAYNEGWAEYAATLAEEFGLYQSPEERYGRLLNEAFLTCRLVVDTGLNALGWSLQRARSFMREHCAIPEAEILTESVRYSCDIPGQALAYKLGDAHILKLRDQARRTLGTGFDLKRFHERVLDSGALPLADLSWHVEPTLNLTS